MSLIGRQREMAAMRSALTEVASGRGKIVMLAGDAGIGKTRLADELAVLAERDGFAVSRGRSHEGEGAPPFWPWIQALRAHLEDNDASELPDLLGLSTYLENRDPAAARFRLADAVAKCIHRVSRKSPALLVLEDLHWADAPSLQLLEFVAHEISDTRALILGTYRDAELPQASTLFDTLGELARAGTDTIRVGALNQEGVGLLLRGITGAFPPPLLLRSVYDHTEGNPFFATEIAHVLAQGETSFSIPDSVKAAIARRYRRLSTRCQSVVTTAAVLGREFDFELLTKIRDDLSEQQLLAVVDEARNSHVIVDASGSEERYQFRHALIRQTLYEDISVSRRVRLHSEIAETLEALYGEAHAAQLAYHFARANNPVKLVRYSKIAGLRALGMHGYESALVQFEAAWDAKKVLPFDGESAEILFGLGVARAATSSRWNRQEAWERLEVATDYFIESGDIVRAVEAVTHPALTPEGTANVASTAQRVLELVEPDSREAGFIVARHAVATYFETIDYDVARRGFRRAASLAKRFQDDALALRTLAYETAMDHFHIRWTDVLAKSERAIEHAKRNDDPHAEIYARYRIGYTLMCTGRSDEARGDAASNLALAEKLGDKGLIEDALYISANLAQLRGDWQTARNLIDRGLELAPYHLPVLHNRVLLEHELGNVDEAEVYLDRLEQACLRAGPYPLRESFAVLAKCHIARLVGRRFDIDQKATRLLVPINAVILDIARAMLAVERGDVESMEDFLERLAPFRGLILAPSLVTDRLLGRLAHRLGRSAEAGRHFEAASTFCRDAGYRPELAWTCYDYGTALLDRPGKETSARAATVLGEASRLTTELGMKPLASLVDGCRQRLAARPVGLTRRELEVLKLVASGSTNKEIAATLFISINTVAVHVARILEKTHTANRTAAANYAIREHLA